MNRIFDYWVDTYFLFRNNLIKSQTKELIDLTEGYSICLINTLEDMLLDSLTSFWSKSYNETPLVAGKNVRSLLQRGDVCMGAIHNNNVIGMTWYGDQAAIREIPFAHILKREINVGIGHHDFIDVNHRGKGLQRALTMVRLKHANENNCHAFYVFVGVKNIASVINLLRVFPEYKIVFHVKIDIPFFSYNFFPGSRREDWSQC